MGRALRLLLLFRDRPTVRVLDAARTLGVANSTAHRMLAMLVHLGFATQDDDSRAYRPGEELVSLSRVLVGREDDLVLVRPALESLTAAVGETSNLAVLRHREVVFRWGVESDQLLRIADQTGQRLPALGSALGRVLLADLPLEELRRRYPEDVVDGWSRATIEAELARVRQVGCSVNEQSDFCSIAVPVGRPGAVSGALAVAAPSGRASPAWRTAALDALRACASRIEAGVGLPTRQ